MSKYSLNEPELLHARQLLNNVEAEFSSLRQRVIYTRNSLYGQQGYGVSEVRDELELQAGALGVQMENLGRMQECIQFIINATVTASNDAKRELLMGEVKQETVNYFSGSGGSGGGGGGGGRMKTAVEAEDMPPSPYELLKKFRKGISGTQDMMEILRLGDAESKYLDGILKSPLLESIGKKAKWESLYKAAQKGDFGKLIDSLGKEVGKKIGKGNGIKGFEFEAYFTMGKVWGKNYSAYVEKCMTEDITFGDKVSAFWSLTGGMLIETGAEIAYDKLTSIIPWYDKYYGGSVSGFYEKLGEIKDSIVDTYGIKGVGDAIVKVGKNTVSFYGDKLSKLFKWRK